MEATAVKRQRLSDYAVSLRRLVAERSRTFWIVAGITGLAAVLRFSTLSLQSFHHDEIVTSGRVVRASFWHLLDKVVSGESLPPLYYVLTWLWTHVAGTGAIGLRSVSAAAPAAAPDKGGDASKGKSVYDATCAVCHAAGEVVGIVAGAGESPRKLS